MLCGAPWLSLYTERKKVKFDSMPSTTYSNLLIFLLQVVALVVPSVLGKTCTRRGLGFADHDDTPSPYHPEARVDGPVA